jgi:amylosucrase
MDDRWLERQAQITLNRLLPRLDERFRSITGIDPEGWGSFCLRLKTNFPRLFRLLYTLYGNQYDFFYHLEDLLYRMSTSWIERAGDLKQLDIRREADPNWYQSNRMLGGVCYVDLFAGDLKKLLLKIPYFKEMGLNYLHLMPLFQVPEAENDGGYAVSSYRQVKSTLGTTEDLVILADSLRQEGISLVLDLIFNHTSDEHDWVKQALAGKLEFQEYYRMFPDRKIPDAYEKNMREIFPDEDPGAFTYRKEIDRWVWTTFHAYQWDLNYANPAVFNQMAGEMLFLANLGVEVLRLDAVAFIWKELGTSNENLPQAHLLIQAFNAVARIASPALLFKSEAIVHPDDVVKYIHPDECQLSYNPLIMALLWNTLATRQVDLLDQALRHRFRLDEGTAWVNYVRCHDDIGWTFSDEDAAQLNINGTDHRRFLNAFYSGRFPGSFARGLPFQENPKTGDVRISGTCASLAGLEKALNEETDSEVDLAIRRILLIYGIILTVGGIPLIYLGDEVGVLNDYSYRQDPAKASDSRWVHRPFSDWDMIARRFETDTLQEKIYTGLQRLIRLRLSNPVFSGQEIQVINTGNPHVIGYVRLHDHQRALVFANFSEEEQSLMGNLLRVYGLGYQLTDMLTGKEVTTQDLKVQPLELICLQA